MVNNNFAYEIVRKEKFATIKNLHCVDSLNSSLKLLKLNELSLWFFNQQQIVYDL